MKNYAKLVLVLAAMLAGTLNASAQDKVEKFGLLNHFSVGLTVGTPGIGFDVATCVGEYVQVRAGAQFFPSIGFSRSFTPTEIPKFKKAINALETLAKNTDYQFTVPSKTVDADAKIGFSSGKFLVDVFPFPKKSNFHVTVGFYFGGSDIVTLRNAKDGILNDFLVPDYKGSNPAVKAKFDQIMAENKIVVGEPLFGLRIGDYQLKPDKNGNLQAGISVNKVRPYVGIGFGRAVPRKRIGFMVELGVQFWGTPNVYIEGGEGRKNLDEEDLSGIKGSDAGLIKTLSKLTIYPNLTFRLCGRIL